MGVKNHAFPLALINPSLQGVDPFSEYLTLEQKAAIALECKINPWYYFREIARAPSQAGAGSFMFEANRGNLALFWLFFNHITLFLIMIRQSGKSFAMDTLTTLLMNILCINTEINLLTKDETLRSSTISRLKDIDLELPPYLKQRSKTDANNTEEITVKSLNNIYKAHVPQKSIKDALKIGRGLTSPIFFIDEAPFQSNISTSLPAALAAGVAARDIARLNEEPYGTILTTTAGKRDDRDGKFIYKLLSDSADWTEKFFDCLDITELELMIRRHSRSNVLRVNCTFSHTQLGKSDEWLKKAIEESMATEPEATNRDFFNKWTVGTMSSPLPLNILEKIRKSQTPESYISIDSPYGYITKWFIPENQIETRMASGHYILSSDTSDASGGDDISLILIDITNGEVVVTGKYNETNLITFAQWLCTWFVRFENFTAIIERRSSGVAILDYLLLMLPTLGIDPFKRLFNTTVNNYQENPEKWREINNGFSRRKSDVYITHKKSFGFATSAGGITSRTELYSTTLQLAGKKIGDKVKDVNIINQIVSLITLNGRVDHPPGENDDMVIAWLLAFWLMTQGKNLEFYGINSKAILSLVNVSEIMDAKTYVNMREQQEIRNKIEDLYEELSNEKDDNIIQKLEQKLKTLNRELVLEDGEKISIDELINSVRDKRRANRYLDRPNTEYQTNYNNRNINRY